MQAYTPTVDWQELHDVHFRKIDVYELNWDAALQTHIGVCGRFGGPVAITKDLKKGQPPPQGYKPSIRIFTQSGRLLSTVETSAKIMGFGVSDSEKLFVVGDDLMVRVFDVHGEAPTTPVNFALPQEVKDQGGILDVHFTPTSLSILTRKLQFCVVGTLEDPQPVMYPSAGLSAPPLCWGVIEAGFTASGAAELLVCPAPGSVVVVEQEKAFDLKITAGPFARIALSPTGKRVALYSAGTGLLHVISTDFTENYCEVNPKSKVPPQQLVWCGTEAFAAQWETGLLVVAPYGDFLRFQYEEAHGRLILASEVDGLRVLSNKTAEFMQMVPQKTEAIFKIGSTHPSAILYDAAMAFHNKAPEADANIRVLRENNTLELAVNCCTESACHEWSTVGQKNLLSAASFGKCFLNSYAPEAYVEAVHELRVLNALRSAEIGMPITHVQYALLGKNVVIDRLTNRHHHFVAAKICKFLKMRPNRVLIHWASAMVTKGRGDEQELCNAIVQKLHSVPGISYAEIAAAAFRARRPQLAAHLLDYEPRASDQIPLLISMKQPELALQKAIDSGDTDLVYLVMLRSMRVMKDEFFSILQGKPVAVRLLLRYAWFDPELARRVLASVNDPERQGEYNVRRAQAAANPEQKARLLQQASDCFGKSKTRAFHRDACADESRLTRLQVDLEAACGGEHTYVGLSVGETLHQLLAVGEDKRADALAKDFHLSDARMCWARVIVFCQKGRWDSLRKFADTKKPVIGFVPFVECCLEHGNAKEAKDYVARIPETHVRASLYVRMEAFREAADCAVILKDPNALMQIRAKCKDRDTQAYVEGLLKNFK